MPVRRGQIKTVWQDDNAGPARTISLRETQQELIEERIKKGGGKINTSIIRKVDPLGRITFPVEMRRLLNIETNDSLAVFQDEKTIILKKYQPECIFCGKRNDEESYQCKGKTVCHECAKELKEQYKE